MDIEGWEFRALLQLPVFFEKINGLVVEFHDLDFAGKKFEEIIDLFSTHFYIAHTHANNFGGLINNTKHPKVLEITFINKAIANDSKLSSQKYPLPGIDFPCNLRGYDYELIF